MLVKLSKMPPGSEDVGLGPASPDPESLDSGASVILGSGTSEDSEGVGSTLPGSDSLDSGPSGVLELDSEGTSVGSAESVGPSEVVAEAASDESVVEGDKALVRSDSSPPRPEVSPLTIEEKRLDSVSVSDALGKSVTLDSGFSVLVGCSSLSLDDSSLLVGVGVGESDVGEGETEDEDESVVDDGEVSEEGKLSGVVVGVSGGKVGAASIDNDDKPSRSPRPPSSELSSSSPPRSRRPPSEPLG